MLQVQVHKCRLVAQTRNDITLNINLKEIIIMCVCLHWALFM